MDKRAEAKRLITYYFRMIAEKAEAHWDSDNDAEIKAAVDLIIDAVKEEQNLEEKRNGNN